MSSILSQKFYHHYTFLGLNENPVRRVRKCCKVNQMYTSESKCETYEDINMENSYLQQLRQSNKLLTIDYHGDIHCYRGTKVVASGKFSIRNDSKAILFDRNMSLNFGEYCVEDVVNDTHEIGETHVFFCTSIYRLKHCNFFTLPHFWGAWSCPPP